MVHVGTISVCFALCSVWAAVSGCPTLDLYVAVDDKVKDVYAKSDSDVETKHDMEYLLTEINKVFERQQGVDIGVRVIKLDILTNDIFQNTTHGAVQRLKASSDFRKYLKDNGIYQKYQYDMAIFFTGYDLLSGEYSKKSYHRFNSVCREDGFAIMNFDGTPDMVLETVETIAKVLGVKYDSGPCNRPRGHIMDYFNRIRPVNENLFDFSTCSVQQLNDVIQEKSCLQGPSLLSYLPNVRASRDMMDMDKMCRRLGATSMSRDPSKHDYQGDSLCETVFCMDDNNPMEDRPMRATEGMACADAKICQFGKCVTSPFA